ncbi:MAG: hypothetical protein ChlgKO_09420 [Chlamydiales bacterium]
MIAAIRPDVSKSLKVETNESKTQRVWERNKAFMCGNPLIAGGTLGILTLIPSTVFGSLFAHIAFSKMERENLAVRILFTTVSLMLISIPVLGFSIGIHDANNIFSKAVARGSYEEVERLIKMGFQPTQKMINLALENKRFGTAILLYDNLKEWSTTSRRDLVDQYNTQLQELREQRHQAAIKHFDQFHPEEMSDEEKEIIELLKEGKYEQLRITHLYSSEAIGEARRILNQKEKTE